MNEYGFTASEERILRTLLARKEIITYQLFETVTEGKVLPGSTYPLEIESMSGYVVTSTNVHRFWLDWIDGHYTLGEEDGIWREVALDELGRDRDKVMKIQQELKKAK